MNPIMVALQVISVWCTLSWKEVYEGSIETLKHLKKDVQEVRKGMECGIALEGFVDIREGDEVVTFVKVEVPREL